MEISELLQEKGISKYRLSKESHVPYTTINDICTGKTQIEKSSAEHVYRIAKTLGVTMEELLAENVHFSEEEECSH